MATNTTNYNLIKPGQDDFYDIDDFNQNADIIDAVLKNVSNMANSSLPEASYTAADVLDKIKTIDGSGSGLDADLLDGKEASAFATAAQGLKADELDTLVNNGAVLSPTLNWGMNSKIQIPEISTPITLDFEGFSITNLLGSDGNCEDVSKWTANQATASLDSTSKVFGNNGMKITLTASNGSLYKILNTITALDTSKYYLFSAYVKNGTAAAINITKDNTGGGVALVSSSITDNTKFSRVGLIIQPSDLNSGNLFSIRLSGISGQTAYVDGVMLSEITAVDYTVGLTACMTKYPYVDGHACLMNPMFENRRHNRVDNGNCEKGISNWRPYTANTTLSVVNGKFRVTGTSGAGTMYQVVDVKPNTDYFITGNGTDGTGGASLFVDDGDLIVALSPSGRSFNSGSYSKVAICMQVKTMGYADFDSIMLVEGTIAPTEYKSCDLQRFVVEGRFEKGDKVHIENKQVSGLRGSKYKALYGKDYDWQFGGDFTTCKCIRIPAIAFSDAYVAGPIGNTLVKSDGSLVNEGPVSSGIANNFNLTTAGGGLSINVPDVDTGWTESINPNNDEVKAFMNGWKAVYTNGTRYLGFISKVDKSFPYVTTTASGTNNALQQVINVVDGSRFSAGDFIQVFDDGGDFRLYIVQSVSGNAITLTVNIAAAISTNNPITICDTATKTNMLNYCKANVAPGYEGYRLTYKLANPEPINDINSPVRGEIWDLVKGDNYITVDSGIVLGEVANPIPDINNIQYAINVRNGLSMWTTGNGQLRNMAERINTVYKNQNYDPKWLHGINPISYYGGKDCMYMPSADFDAFAMYTVDYQVLKTLHAMVFGSLSLSYRQSIVNSLNGLSKALEQKQAKDSALDYIVDLSVYEDLGAVQSSGVFINNNSNFVFLDVIIHFIPKKCIPRITADVITIGHFNSSGGYITITNRPELLFAVGEITTTHARMSIAYTGTDTTIRNNLINNGGYIRFTGIKVDCRGRV